MDIQEIEKRIQEINSKTRYKHCLGVRDEAIKLANLYGADPEKAGLAGLVHDCVKGMEPQQMIDFYKEYNLDIKDITCEEEKLRHAKVGAYYAKLVFGIEDEEIFDAVYYHTTGKPDMPLLTKIIYIADYIEPNRRYDGVNELRNLAYKDLDAAILDGLSFTVKKLVSNNKVLHIDTVMARNFILKERNKLV